ncbi:hypothetical protein AB4254_08620 [Vibrio breoganii]
MLNVLLAAAVVLGGLFIVDGGIEGAAKMQFFDFHLIAFLLLVSYLLLYGYWSRIIVTLIVLFSAAATVWFDLLGLVTGLYAYWFGDEVFTREFVSILGTVKLLIIALLMGIVADRVRDGRLMYVPGLIAIGTFILALNYTEPYEAHKSLTSSHAEHVELLSSELKSGESSLSEYTDLYPERTVLLADIDVIMSDVKFERLLGESGELFVKSMKLLNNDNVLQLDTSPLVSHSDNDVHAVAMEQNGEYLVSIVDRHYGLSEVKDDQYTLVMLVLLGVVLWVVVAIAFDSPNPKAWREHGESLNIRLEN